MLQQGSDELEGFMANFYYRFSHHYTMYHFSLLALGILFWIFYIIVIIIKKYIFRKDYDTISMKLFGKNQGTYEEEIDKIKANEL